MAVKILFTGDVVIQNNDVTVDNIWDDGLKDRLKDYGWKCCNFEGSIRTDVSSPLTKIGPTIGVSPLSINLLKESGFNIIAFANNHAMDYGREGLNAAMDNFFECSVMGAGTYEQAYKEIILDDGETKVGLLNGAENGYGSCMYGNEFGFAWLNSPAFYGKIKEVRKKVDYLILVLHCGVENVNLPLPEWREQFKFYIDEYNVDAIVAHHPHVWQGYEEYHGGLIFYSLGNFIWDKKPLYSNETILVGLDIEKRNCQYEIIPVRIEGHRVYMNDSLEFANKIKRLCEILEAPDYSVKVDGILESIYEERYLPIFADITHMRTGGCRSIIHNICRSLFPKKKLKDISVFHNVGIESHQYFLRRISRKNFLEE